MLRVFLSVAVATLAAVVIHTTLTGVASAIADAVRPLSVGALSPR